VVYGGMSTTAHAPGRAPPPRDWKEGRRPRALELAEAGGKAIRSAAALGVTRGAVRQWLKAARAGGRAGGRRRGTGRCRARRPGSPRSSGPRFPPCWRGAPQRTGSSARCGPPPGWRRSSRGRSACASIPPTAAACRGRFAGPRGHRSAGRASAPRPPFPPGRRSGGRPFTQSRGRGAHHRLRR